MKLKLFSATVLLALTLSGCGTPSASSESEPNQSSQAGSMAQKSESTPKPSSSSAPKSSSSAINTIPPFSSVPNSTGTIPTMPSPLDSEGKFPATGQVPEEAMSQEFLRLFAYNSKPQIFINMSKEALKAMSDLQHDRNNRKFYDVYFPANFRLILDGRVYDYDEVGVRMKGNWSRKEIVDFSGNNIARLSHLKISFKATFDDDVLYNQPETRQFKKDWTEIPAERAARKDRNLFGMDKIDLKYTPRNDSQGTGTPDNACIGREVYCYDRFREQDLLAPYSNLGSVTLNNGLSSKSGTMELVECVDKAFLKKRYSKSDRKGNLYKCAKNVAGARANFKGDNAIDKTGGTNGNAPLDSRGFEIGTRKAKGIIGVEDCFNGYDPVYQLKTNDDLGEGADFSDLEKVIATREWTKIELKKLGFSFPDSKSNFICSSFSVRESFTKHKFLSVIPKFLQAFCKSSCNAVFNACLFLGFLSSFFRLSFLFSSILIIKSGLCTRTCPIPIAYFFFGGKITSFSCTFLVD